jgi:hypothetical protein
MGKRQHLYAVTGKLTITVTTVVLATSEAEAKSIAEERPTSGSWRDGGNLKEEWVHDELDGEPTVLSITALPAK